MWAPHPRGRVIRRPQPNFSHHRSRIKHRLAPPELLDSIPDPRCNYKYFGIHRSDVTDHLKQTVPSHAFHPSLVGEPPPVPSGRSSRHAKDKRHPETTPAATVWFGRTCSDVSDWLRYRPPAHLGLDPDNKPLPHYPSTSSLVTDPKWQTREFPALPNVLWHWWRERPSSVPLATNPQKVTFETLVDALKERVIRPRGPYTPPISAPPTLAPTPRSGAQTPQVGTPRHKVSTSQGETQSRVHTPQLQGSKDQLNATSLKDFPTRPASASSSVLISRPPSAPSSALASRPASAPNAFSTNHATPTSQLGKNGCTNRSPQHPSTPRHNSTGENPQTPNYLGPCGCASYPGTPRSPHSARGLGTPTLPPTSKPQVEAQKCGCDHTSSTHVSIPSLNLQSKANGGASCTTPTTNKPSTPPIRSAKPPPSPGLSHPNPPHVPRESTPLKPCGRNHNVDPPSLYVQGQGQGQGFNNNRVEKRVPREEIARASQGLNLDDMKQMSPNSFATKIVWAEKFKKHGKGMPWPLEEKKAMKVVKAY